MPPDLIQGQSRLVGVQGQPSVGHAARRSIAHRLSEKSF